MKKKIKMIIDIKTCSVKKIENFTVTPSKFWFDCVNGEECSLFKVFNVKSGKGIILNSKNTKPKIPEKRKDPVFYFDGSTGHLRFFHCNFSKKDGPVRLICPHKNKVCPYIRFVYKSFIEQTKVFDSTCDFFVITKHSSISQYMSFIFENM